MCMPPKKDYVSYWNTSIDQRIISPVNEVDPCSSENTPGIVQVGSSGRYGVDLVGVGSRLLLSRCSLVSCSS